MVLVLPAALPPPPAPSPSLTAGQSSQAPPRLVCPAAPSGPAPGRPRPPSLGWGGGLSSPEQSGVLRTRPHGAGDPQTFPFSVRRAAPAPPPAPHPRPPPSHPLPSPAPSTAIMAASPTGPGWALPSLCHRRKLENKPQASWASSTRARVGSPPAPPQWLPLWTCLFPPGLHIPAWSSQWAFPSGHVSPTQPPLPRPVMGGGGGRRTWELGPGCESCPAPLAVCGLGRASVVVSVSHLLNGPKEGSLVLKRFFSVLSGDQPPPRGSRGWAEVARLRT